MPWWTRPTTWLSWALEGACTFGRCRSLTTGQPLPERRKVIALVIRRDVTEYRIVAGACACGRCHRSRFPEDIGAPVQYGAGVSAFAVYMTQCQLLPFERAAALLTEVAGIAISPGSLYLALETAAARLQSPVAAIGEALVGASMAHADEAGVRVGGALQWLHVFSNAGLTAYFAHPKRGRVAFGLLARVDCLHAFCNAHHLREQSAIAETIPSQRPGADGDARAALRGQCARRRGPRPGICRAPGAVRARHPNPLRRHPCAGRPGSRGRVRALPATSLNACARTARRCCVSSPTYACRSTITRSSAISARPRSSIMPRDAFVA